MNISITGSHPTLRFAASELARYLRLATGQRVTTLRQNTVGVSPNFRIGIADDLLISIPKAARGGDWICIRPEQGGYVISGSNHRSVLFAAYRFLTEIGFRWVRPGKDGVIIPELPGGLPEVSRIEEQPSCKFRTICIEGVCSFEHARDMIDWAAKQGMNGFFLQFEYGWYFWRRWYEHEGNNYWPGEPFSLSDAQVMAGRVIDELKKRDLLFERVGHGWTCAVLGIDGEGWDTNTNTLPDDKMAWPAEVNGKREFSGGVPLNTNLCYSNPDVRNALVDVVFQYAKAHLEVDVLHFWLGDGMNNNCECKECQKARPADFYVAMLNDLDARLTAEGLQTKIVFLIYVDLLWPPLKEKLKNEERFIMMFAPITRSFLQPLADAPTPAIPDFTRNHLKMPNSAEENIAFLRAWREHFSGGAFDFDYHLLWVCSYDLNHVTLAEVLHHDIANYASLELQGLNSCQVQRHGFPHNLLQDVMARTLWNTEVSFDAIAETTFSDAYGLQNGREVLGFFCEMSRLWKPFLEPVFAHQFSEERLALCRANHAQMSAVVDDFRPCLKQQPRGRPPAVLLSWRYLGHYVKLLDLLLPAYGSYLTRSSDCREKFEAVFDYLWRNEKTLHPALDVLTLVGVLKGRITEAEKFAETMPS